MKRFLLSVAVVAMATVASAQVVLSNKAELGVVASARPELFRVPELSVSSVVPAGRTLEKVAMKKAESTTLSIAGEWIENDDSDVPETNVFTISAVEGYSDVNCKVEGLVKGYATVYGLWDVETKTLTIPGAQICYEYKEYGEMSLLGMVDTGDGKVGLSEDDIIFEMDEDGTLSLSNYDGLFIYMENEQFADQPCWTYAFAPELFRPNGVMEVYNSTKNGWVPSEDVVYVDDWGFQVTVYNFVGMSAVSIDIDEETLKCEMPAGQPVYDYTGTTVDTSIYGNMHVVAADSDAEGWFVNEEKEAVACHIEGNKILSDEYFLLVSNFDEEGNAYGMGWFSDLTITKTDGYQACGISQVATSTTSPSTKIYNALGQQVNAKAKGLVICNGKKRINK